MLHKVRIIPVVCFLLSHHGLSDFHLHVQGSHFLNRRTMPGLSPRPGVLGWALLFPPLPDLYERSFLRRLRPKELVDCCNQYIHTCSFSLAQCVKLELATDPPSHG